MLRQVPQVKESLEALSATRQRSQFWRKDIWQPISVSLLRWSCKQSSSSFPIFRTFRRWKDTIRSWTRQLTMNSEAHSLRVIWRIWLETQTSKDSGRWRKASQNFLMTLIEASEKDKGQTCPGEKFPFHVYLASTPFNICLVARHSWLAPSLSGAVFGVFFFYFCQ